jgi:protoporphyrinogen oxidase
VESTSEPDGGGVRVKPLAVAGERSEGNPSVTILGGGLSGCAVAWSLALAGWRGITVVERGPRLGGLAGSFEADGRFYPLGYHHILDRDRTLLFFLERLDALSRVRWRRIRMLFEEGGRLFDLASPAGMLTFPLALVDKARLARLLLRAWTARGWSSWEGRSAEELLDEWAGPRVREALFEPLTRLKFDLPCRDVSAAWMGERLRYREGSAPLGFIPGTNWTTVLCEGLAKQLADLGVEVRLNTAVERVVTRDGRAVEAELAGGGRVAGDLVVSTLPAPAYARLVPQDATPEVGRIRYTALLSLVCATRQRLPREFYWLNLSSLSHTASGLFVLSSLNPTIGGPGETCLNFVTHLGGADRALFQAPEEELFERYRQDLRELFGLDLVAHWKHLSRIPLYSPVFERDYRNPPPRSASLANVRFAGTYRTHPSVASTGTALQSGLECAARILADHGLPDALAAEARLFRPGHLERHLEGFRRPDPERL